MQPCGCHMGSVTHAVVWLSHGQCHKCSRVAVTCTGTVDRRPLYSIISVTRLSCGCQMCIDCFFCRSEPDISPRPKSPVSGSREPANNDTDSVTSDIPTRCMSSPASYMSVDNLRAEVEAVS